MEAEEAEEEGGGLELSNPYRITAASTNDVPRLKSIEIWKRAGGEDVGWNPIEGGRRRGGREEEEGEKKRRERRKQR